MSHRREPVSDIVGAGELLAKQSAVDARGEFRGSPIDGLQFRPTRPVVHEDGHLTEVARANWNEFAAPIVQVHVTTTLPARVRAWGLHERSTDRLFVVEGLVRMVAFDGRRESPTFGAINEFMVSPRSPGVLVIPPNVFHGWRNIGASEAIIINMPTVMYNHDAPDALDLPWDSDEARRLIPYIWP